MFVAMANTDSALAFTGAIERLAQAQNIKKSFALPLAQEGLPLAQAEAPRSADLSPLMSNARTRAVHLSEGPPPRARSPPPTNTQP